MTAPRGDRQIHLCWHQRDCDQPAIKKPPAESPPAATMIQLALRMTQAVEHRRVRQIDAVHTSLAGLISVKVGYGL